MNSIPTDLLLSFLISSLASWFITHKYYIKSIEIQERENIKERKDLIEALRRQNENDATLLTQQYIDASVEAWKKQGTVEHYLNSLEISKEEKEKIFKASCLRYKNREPKNNPYK